MSSPSEIPFQTLLNSLSDEETPLNPHLLYRLSDLDADELALFINTWPQLPLWRRQALMENLEELGIADDLLSFEAIGRHAISDTDPKVRLAAVRVLWEFEVIDMIPVFLRLLETDPEVDVRAAAATALGQYIYLAEIDEIPKAGRFTLEDRLLQVIAGNDAAQVRRHTLESISFSSRAEIPPLIETAFSSGDIDWIASALTAMGRSMDRRWEEDVLSMLDSKLPSLRAEAARAAGELEISEAITSLVDLAEDSNEDVRTAAIWSLSQIGGEKARRTLNNLLLKSEEDDEFDYLETALDNLAFTEGLDPFTLLDLPEDEAESDLYDTLMEEEDLDYFEDEEDDEGEFLNIEEFYEEDEDRLD